MLLLPWPRAQDAAVSRERLRELSSFVAGPPTPEEFGVVLPLAAPGPVPPSGSGGGDGPSGGRVQRLSTSSGAGAAEAGGGGGGTGLHARSMSLGGPGRGGSFNSAGGVLVQVRLLTGSSIALLGSRWPVAECWARGGHGLCCGWHGYCCGSGAAQRTAGAVGRASG